MQQTVTIHIPRAWMRGVPEEELTWQHVVNLGIYQYKIERAIRLYQDQIGSLGYIAEQLGLPKQDLMRELRWRGIEPIFSEETIQEELDA